MTKATYKHATCEATRYAHEYGHGYNQKHS